MAFLDAQFEVKTSDVIAFSEPQRLAVEMSVSLSIAFEGEWLYKNLKHPRYKNFYGYAQLMSGAFVVQDIPLTFINQELVHWRDQSFGINDTTLCMGKFLANLIQPSAKVGALLIKTRQRFTSIRFRLLGGIVANVTYVWQVGESGCGNVVLDPDAKQGQPAVPNNGGASGSPRPSDQGGDPVDPSANDGNYDPNSGLQPPPRAGGGSSGGTWKAQISGYRQDDSFYVFQFDTLISDPTAVVLVFGIPYEGVPNNSAGKSADRIVVSENGVSRVTDGGGWLISFFPVYYY